MKNLLKKIGILIMVALMSVSLIACSSGSKGSGGGGGGGKSSKSTPEAALEAITKAYEDRDAEKAFELMYDPYFLEYMIEEGYDDKEEALEYYAERFEDEIEEAEDWFGKNLKYSIDVLDKTELDKDEVAAVNRYLYEEYGHIYDDKEVIEEICILEVETTFEGDKDSDEEEEEGVAYKIDGKWYIDNISIYIVEEALDEYGE